MRINSGLLKTFAVTFGIGVVIGKVYEWGAQDQAKTIIKNRQGFLDYCDAIREGTECLKSDQ